MPSPKRISRAITRRPKTGIPTSTETAPVSPRIMPLIEGRGHRFAVLNETATSSVERPTGPDTVIDAWVGEDEQRGCDPGQGDTP
jgi:hypothetical protein